MAIPTLKSVVSYGQKDGRPPEEIAAAVQQWRKDILTAGKELAKEDPEAYWKGSSQAEADAQAILTNLNQVRRQKLLTEVLPDPQDQKNFLYELDAYKGDLPPDANPKFKAAEAALLKADEDPLFQGAKGFSSKIRQGSNELGSYQIRQTPDGDYEALVTPTGGDKKPQLKRFSVDREKLLSEQLPEYEEAGNVASARLKTSKNPETFGNEFGGTESRSEAQFKDIAYKQQNQGPPDELSAFGPNAATLGPPEQAPGNRPTEASLAAVDSKFAALAGRREFLQKATEVQLLDDQLTEVLRKDEKFLKTVPENTLQQYTTRPLRQTYADLQNAGTGVSDLLSGTTSSGKAAKGRQAYIDKEAPGELRSRFETKGESIGDDLASGIQSMVPLYGPAAALKLTGLGGKIASGSKVASPLLRASGIPGAGLAAQALEAPAAAAGWTSLFATAYGANYAAALQEADALEATDPARAKKIRSMAQFSSFANAGLELATEKIPFGDEAKVFSGTGATLRGAAAIPLKEGIEEGIGAMAQNTVGAVFDTGREAEDVGAAVKGGLIGGVPFAGVSAAVGLANQQKDPVIAIVPTPVGPVPKSVIGGEVLSRVPVTTPIEEVMEITNNLTEGEQRLKDLENPELDRPLQFDPEQTPTTNQPGATPPELQSSEAEQQGETPGTTLTTSSNEEIQNEPQEAAGDETVQPELLKRSESDPEVRQPTGYITNPTEAGNAVAFVNEQLGSKLEVEPAPPTKLARFAEQIASISGRQVVYVKGDSGFDGVQNGNYLIVRTNSPQALRKLVGHELAHSFESDPGYKGVVDVLKNRDAAAYQEYAARLKKLNYADNRIEAEFVADTIGEAIHDRAFWRKLTQETDPTVLQRIADAILSVIDKVQDFSRTTFRSGLGKGRPNASKILNDLASARTTIQELIKGAGPANTRGIKESVPQSVPQSASTRTDVTARDDGPYTSGGEVIGHGFTIIAPGHPKHNSSGIAEPGEDIQEVARQSVEDYDKSLPQSKSTEPVAPTQDFGVLDDAHIVTTMESLHEIADTIVPVGKITLADYEDARKTVKSLMRQNGAAKTKIEKAVAERFAERLRNKPKAEREKEQAVLGAMTVAAIRANLMRMAINLYGRKGEKNKSRAIALRQDNLRLGDVDVFQVSGDVHTAARILRAVQMDDPSGVLTQVVQDLRDSSVDFLDSKNKGSGKAAQQIELELANGVPDAIIEAARVAGQLGTQGGEEYVKAEFKAKSKIRAFFDKWILGRESRSGDEVKRTRSVLMAAIDRLEGDYSGNVDQVLELLEDAVNRLSPSKLAKAQEELTRLVEMDIRLAENNYDVYGDDRNLTTAAKGFIKRTSSPATRQRKQAASDLSALRQAVREGTQTPQQAAQAFIEAGGDPGLQTDLEAAFEADAQQKIHNDQVKEEAKQARKAVKDAIRQGNERARVELSDEKLVKMAQKAAKEASDALVEQVGEEVARGEEFSAFVTQVAENAARQAAQDLVDTVGQSVAQKEDIVSNMKERAEAFAKRVEEQAEKAAKAEALKTAKELIAKAKKARAKASRELVKEVGSQTMEEHDFAREVERQAKEATKALEEQAKNVIRKPGEKLIGPKKKPIRSLQERIAQKLEEHPDFDVSNKLDRIKIIKEILRDAGVDAELIDAAAEGAVAAFHEHLEKLAQKTTEQLGKQLLRGKLTAELLQRAIRLRVLDPSKPLTESLAAVEGWQGLTGPQFDKIFEMAAAAGEVTEPQARLAMWQEITRMILASGVPPKWKDVISSSVRASMYGGIASLGLQGFASLNSLIYIPLRRVAERIVRNPLKAMNPLELLSTLQEAAVSITKNLKPALRSGALAFWRNAGLALPASQEKLDQVGVLSVDALVRKMDIAVKRMKDKNLSVHSRIMAGFDWLWKGLRQIVWRMYGFFDSFNITMQKRFLTDTQINDQMRKAGVNGRDAYKAYMDTVDANIRYAKDVLKLPDDMAAVEGRHRAETGWFGWLREQNLQPEAAALNGFREAIHAIGNHAEVQGLLSQVANKVVDVSQLVPGGLGPAILGPTRIPSNIVDAMLWHLPGFNIFRIAREYAAQREGKRSGKFSGRFHLAAGTPFLFKRRMVDVIMSNGMFWPFLSLFLSGAGDEDDPDSWFHYEGAAPTNQAERNEFFGQGRKEYSLSIGKRGERQTRILLTRGVFEFLNYPLAAAKHTAEVLKGKRSIDGASVDMGADIARIGLPSIEGVHKIWETVESEDDNRMRKTFADIASAYLPLSAFSRSAVQAAGIQPHKDDSNYLLGRLIPATVLFNKDGQMEPRNFLNENPMSNTDPVSVISRMGLPVSIFVEQGVQDPVLAKDFKEANYFPAPAESLKEFKKSYEGREKEVWKANGVENDAQLYTLFIAKRAEAFKEIYKEDPAPGQGAKDDRTAQQRLEAEDYPAYKERVGAFRAKATRETKLEMEITEEE